MDAAMAPDDIAALHARLDKVFEAIAEVKEDLGVIRGTNIPERLKLHSERLALLERWRAKLLGVYVASIVATGMLLRLMQYLGFLG